MFRISFQLVEIPTFLAEIYSYSMILNSNILFWTTKLEYPKIISRPHAKISPVISRNKTNTNVGQNVCEPQLQYIPNIALACFSLGSVRALKLILL